MQNRFPHASTRITLARAQEKPGNWPKIKRMNSLCPLHYSFLLGILDPLPPPTLGKGWEVATEVITLGIEREWMSGERWLLISREGAAAGFTGSRISFLT